MTDPNSVVSVHKRRGYQSLFFKLFIVLLGSVLLTYLAFGGFYRSNWNENARIDSHPNQIHYWSLLSDEIGLPPDTVAASRLSGELGIAIGIKGPHSNWNAPDFSGDIWQLLDHDTIPDSLQMFLRKGRLWAAIPKGPYTFIYGSRRKPPIENIGRDWFVLFIFTFLAWVLAWTTLHRMLRPIRNLETGVNAVAEGNLSIKLSERGHDELAGLARSFNSMTRSLKERLHARDQLLLDVSHELRSPLTRMRVALEMAAPGMAVSSLKDEVGSLEKMVSELLETERLNSETGGLKLKSEDLGRLIKEKISTVAGQTPGIVWTGEPLPPIPLDGERMKLVIRNILDNALKYGPAAARPVEVSLRKEEGFAVVDIRDFGPGIPPEEQRLVFEPFYRVDRSRSMSPGYGLGLSLCKRIVEMHGGNISLESRVGDGTKVTIKLPLNS